MIAARERGSWGAALAAVGFAAGCGSPSEPPAEPPTPWERAVPVLEQRCIGCHADGGAAPFSVASHAQAAPWAEAMADAARSRRMPPFLADNSGSCGTFEAAAWLSEDEIDALAAWAAAAPDPDAPVPIEPQPAPQQQIVAPDRVVDIGAPYTPSQSPDEYRCFVVDPELDADRFLTAYQVVPGDPALVHHVILYTLDSAAAEATADDLDALDAEPGYACYGSSIVPESRPIAAWAPGTPPTAYPDGTGVRLVAGHRLVLQVHYNTAARTGSDQTRIELSLAEGVAKEAFVALLTDTTMSLPPGAPDATHTLELPLGQLGLPLGAFIHGVFPHMHTRGRALRLDLVRAADGSEACAVDVPRWDFAWQQLYFYRDPLYVDPDDTLRLTCSYDTTGDAEPVPWGEGTGDEMCLVGVVATF